MINSNIAKWVSEIPTIDEKNSVDISIKQSVLNNFYSVVLFDKTNSLGDIWILKEFQLWWPFSKIAANAGMGCLGTFDMLFKS